MAILGLEAGKHVYVEKPCSYNPDEGQMLVRAAAKYGKLCQMGSQQRSSPHTIEIIGKIHGGSLGRAYWAETWYANNRKPIGIGKEIPVPPTLDWDLWQGPAPRTAYKDNVHPYNWHCGSNAGARARRSTTVRMRWTLHAGLCRPGCRSASRRAVAAMPPRTTGSSTTRWTWALNTLTSSSRGRVIAAAERRPTTGIAALRFMARWARRSSIAGATRFTTAMTRSSTNSK